MTERLAELVRLADFLSPGDGCHELPFPNARCMKISQPTYPVRRRWRASLSIVVQGCKEITLSREVYRCDQAHYVATLIDLPVASQVCAVTPEKPFLCFSVDMDPLILSELMAHLSPEAAGNWKGPARAVFAGKASDAMLDAAARIGKLCRTPEDAPLLGPLAAKELLYYLLKGADGPAIRQFVRAGSSLHQIAQAVYGLQAELAADVDVAALAAAAHMSRSAFFQRFKEVTAFSPKQYQKRLRLLEARRLMAEDGETAEGAAFKVGYNSASQFSREYVRLFGSPPRRDAQDIQKTGRRASQM